MPNEQKTGYVASKRDLAKTENNSSMTKPVATVTNSTTDLLSIKQQSNSKITVSIYEVILISARKYPLRGYILCVVKHATVWGCIETLK